VIGVLPGILGSLQANEVIKVISGVGDPLAGRLFQFDAAEFKTRIFKISKDPDNPLTGLHPTQTELIDYEFFCGINLNHPTMNNQQSNGQLTVTDLNDWIKSGKDFQLIDVREPYEYEIANLGGLLIPKGEILLHLDQIDQSKDVVIYCRSGKRSQDVIDLLKQKDGFSNLYNLKGGILAWADQIDPSMAKY
jgi:sulfur-carrier protein adenylyltransferase/sulfurtransferase